jgi:hypothetical protein
MRGARVALAGALVGGILALAATIPDRTPVVVLAILLVGLLLGVDLVLALLRRRDP